jgi:glycosyltransferase involved in cell wall biosynthesis
MRASLRLVREGAPAPPPPAAAAPAKARAIAGAVVVLTSPSQAPCGVEGFARGLAEAIQTEGTSARTLAVSGRPGDVFRLWRGLQGAEALVVNLPVVAWKKALLTPLVALIIARLSGRDAAIVLHEWADLKPARRIACALYVLVARTLLFSSPSVRAEFEHSPLGLPKARGALMPIPPNIAPAEALADGPLIERIRGERARGALILGHFGSLYPKKRNDFALDVAAALRDMGRACFLVYIGGAVDSEGAAEAALRARARSLGLADSCAISGYVRDSPRLFALLEACDVFVYGFAGGLTSRRGSVLACLEAGRPVVVNAPADPGEFDHHPTYRELLAGGALRLVATQAPAEAYANAILAATAQAASETSGRRDLYTSAWRDAARALIDRLNRHRPLDEAEGSNEA